MPWWAVVLIGVGGMVLVCVLVFAFTIFGPQETPEHIQERHDAVAQLGVELNKAFGPPLLKFAKTLDDIGKAITKNRRSG